MAVGRFTTAINCIDGRTQRPVSEWIRIQFSVDYVDTITQPGPEAALTHGPASVIEVMRQNVGVSIQAHQSQMIAVAAHHECAGNPVSDEEHKEQVRAACAVIAQWGYPARIVGLWVNEWWQVEVVTDTGAASANE